MAYKPLEDGPFGFSLPDRAIMVEDDAMAWLRQRRRWFVANFIKNGLPYWELGSRRLFYAGDFREILEAARTLNSN